MIPTLVDGAYSALARPVLFRATRGDAERAHQVTLAVLRFAGRRPLLLRAMARIWAAPPRPRTVAGVVFPQVVGLAAGADKNGIALAAWPALGFGFVEVGTVTALAQPGHARPRVARLPDSGGVINHMGFPNDGAAALARRLANGPSIGVPVGISLGKSRATPLGEAIGDYVKSLRAVGRYADYLAVNVSSPNTAGLRGLQNRAALTDLLTELRHQAADSAVIAAGKASLPIFVKIAPDLTDSALAELIDVCEDRGVAGVIATNTTIGRAGIAVSDEHLASLPGGLSGRPLHERALRVVGFVAAHTELPIIGVGGIDSVAAGLAMLDAGASLLQVYTGLLYAGPRLVRDLAAAGATRGRQ